MEVPHRVVGRGGQHGAAEQPPVRVRPELIQPGEGHQLIRPGVEVIRDLLPVRSLLPLLISFGRDQSPPLDRGLAKGRLVQDGFAAGVDQLRTDLHLLRPGRDKIPPGDQQPPLHRVLIQPFGDDRHPLGRCHIPAWRRWLALDVLRVEMGQEISGPPWTSRTCRTCSHRAPVRAAAVVSETQSPVVVSSGICPAAIRWAVFS